MFRVLGLLSSKGFVVFKLCFRLPSGFSLKNKHFKLPVNIINFVANLL